MDSRVPHTVPNEVSDRLIAKARHAVASVEESQDLRRENNLLRRQVSSLRQQLDESRDKLQRVKSDMEQKALRIDTILAQMKADTQQQLQKHEIEKLRLQQQVDTLLQQKSENKMTKEVQTNIVEVLPSPELDRMAMPDALVAPKVAMIEAETQTSLFDEVSETQNDELTSSLIIMSPAPAHRCHLLSSGKSGEASFVGACLPVTRTVEETDDFLLAASATAPNVMLALQIALTHFYPCVKASWQVASTGPILCGLALCENAAWWEWHRIPPELMRQQQQRNRSGDQSLRLQENSSQLSHESSSLRLRIASALEIIMVRQFATERHAILSRMTAARLLSSIVGVNLRGPFAELPELFFQFCRFQRQRRFASSMNKTVKKERSDTLLVSEGSKEDLSNASMVMFCYARATGEEAVAVDFAELGNTNVVRLLTVRTNKQTGHNTQGAFSSLAIDSSKWIDVREVHSHFDVFYQAERSSGGTTVEIRFHATFALGAAASASNVALILDSQVKQACTVYCVKDEADSSMVTPSFWDETFCECFLVHSTSSGVSNFTTIRCPSATEGETLVVVLTVKLTKETEGSTIHFFEPKSSTPCPIHVQYNAVDLFVSEVALGNPQVPALKNSHALLPALPLIKQAASVGTQTRLLALSTVNQQDSSEVKLALDEDNILVQLGRAPSVSHSAAMSDLRALAAELQSAEISAAARFIVALRRQSTTALDHFSEVLDCVGPALAQASVIAHLPRCERWLCNVFDLLSHYAGDFVVNISNSALRVAKTTVINSQTVWKHSELLLKWFDATMDRSLQMTSVKMREFSKATTSTGPVWGEADVSFPHQDAFVLLSLRGIERCNMMTVYATTTLATIADTILAQSNLFARDAASSREEAEDAIADLRHLLEPPQTAEVGTLVGSDRGSAMLQLLSDARHNAEIASYRGFYEDVSVERNKLSLANEALHLQLSTQLLQMNALEDRCQVLGHECDALCGKLDSMDQKQEEVVRRLAQLTQEKEELQERLYIVSKEKAQFEHREYAIHSQHKVALSRAEEQIALLTEANQKQLDTIEKQNAAVKALKQHLQGGGSTTGSAKTTETRAHGGEPVHQRSSSIVSLSSVLEPGSSNISVQEGQGTPGKPIKKLGFAQQPSSSLSRRPKGR